MMHGRGRALPAKRTFVRVHRRSTDQPSGLIPAEQLPCPACHRLTKAYPVYDGTEEVACESCGKLLRQRAALSSEQRAQARILRWAAAQIEATMTTRHRRKPRGGSDEIFEQGIARTVENLLTWSRLVHKLPRIEEPSQPDAAER